MAIYWCLSSPLPEVGALYSGLVSRTRIDSTGRPPEGTLPMTATTPTTTAAPATGQGAGPRAWGFTLLGLVRIFIGFYFLWAFADKLLGLGFSTPKEGAWINGGSPTTGFLGGSIEGGKDRKSTRLNSSHVAISYAVFCLK